MSLDRRGSLGGSKGAVVLGIVALGALQFASAAPAAATPSVRVMPSSGLTNGEIISVSGAGFAANAADINVVQCPVSDPSATACNLADGTFFVHTDRNGAFAVSMPVKTRFGPTDCTKVACMIVAHEGTDPSSGATAQQTITFGTTAARTSPPAATPAVTTPGAATTGAAVGGVATSAAPGNSVAPTAADTGRAELPRPPLISEALAAAGAIVLAVGLYAHRRRRRSTAL